MRLPSGCRPRASPMSAGTSTKRPEITWTGPPSSGSNVTSSMAASKRSWCGNWTGSSRSIVDGVTTLAKWCEQGIRVVSVTQQLDFNGAMGKMLAAIFFGVAEMEQETRRERQRVGIEAARERGVYRGRRKGTFKATPARARELLAKGMQTAEIARALGVSRRTVERYVSVNP